MIIPVAFFVLLLALPAMAAADDSAPLCAPLATRFAGAPRSLSIAELDELRTCINVQRAALLNAQRQAQRAALMAQRTHVRPSLRDDL